MTDCGDVKKVFVAPPTPSSVSPTPRSGVEITDIAAAKIKLFLEKDNKSPHDYGLHIAVVKDGCSGKSYVMEMRLIAEAAEKGDRVFTHLGATIIVEKLSYLFITGSILDYTEALTGSGFSLNNPNIKKTCSCGSSFAV